MTAKQFFKSTAFKCLVVLTSILLVCGIFLTVMYSFLKVTDEERADRAVKKIYGREVKREADLITDGEIAVGNAYIEHAYPVSFEENGEQVNHILVSSRGTGGYSGGSVTCWVAVVVEDDVVTGIDKVVIGSNVNQSFIGNVTNALLDGFTEDWGNLSVEDVYYTVNKGDTSVTGGATMSSTAICNSVNAALEYVDVTVLGHARIDPFEAFINKEKIETSRSSYTVEGGVVTYNIVTKGQGNAGAFTLTITVGADKTIASFVIVDNGSTGGYEGSMGNFTDGLVGKNLQYFTDMLGDGYGYPGNNADKDISTGASQSNYLCAYACVFALSNYDTAVAAGGVQ